MQLHPKLALEAASAQDRQAEADRQLAATLEDLEALPSQGDLAPLTDLTTLLRAGGDPAARLDTARRKLREAEAALRTALGAIPDCKLGEAALGTTAAPSEARLDSAGKALSHAETTHERATQTHAARLTAIEAERVNLAALERSAMLPPPDALANARAHRDALWAQLCTPPPTHPDPATAVALDRAIRDADTVADALISHSQDLATATAMRGRLAALETDLAKDTAAEVQAATALADARYALLAIAQAAGGNATDVSTPAGLPACPGNRPRRPQRPRHHRRRPRRH